MISSSGTVSSNDREVIELASDTISDQSLIQTGTENPPSVTETGKSPPLEDARFPPLGAIVDYAGIDDPSSAWIICDGRELSTITYRTLFSVIGTMYGVGNGADTFNIPDLRGRVALGAGLGPGLSQRLLASKAGEEQVTLTNDQMPKHRHALSDPGHQHQESFYSSFGGPLQGAGHTAIPAQASIFTGISKTGITIAETGEGRPHSNMQPFLALNKIIRVI